MKNKPKFSKIETVISEAKKGKIFILVDDENRENEGDLVFLANKTTPEKINFMAKYGRGLICLALEKSKADQLGLQLMPSSNQSRLKTAFTISIEARKGVTTGISAYDRCKTILTAIKKNSSKNDIATPGHIFPLVARNGGCLVRAGHTEASVDIAKLSKTGSSAVICEIMNDDGSMAKQDQLMEYAKKHKLKIAKIEDLISYRLKKETLIYLKEKRFFNLDQSQYLLKTFVNKLDGLQHLAIIKGSISGKNIPKVRVLSSNSIDIFLNKSINAKVKKTLSFFKKTPNFVLLIIREGDLSDMPKTFSSKNIKKNTTKENSLRYYGVGAQILKNLKIKKMILVSSAKKRLVALHGFGIKITKQEILK
jgi:3,4-dihydroxy 2-butanone 4-phosphate synthase / GTP cyclohydrolase II